MARRNGCRGKVRHRTKEAAIITMKKQKNAGLNTYPCPLCGGWHIGRSNRPDKIIARIDQLLERARS
jgi:predicted RNA-binding Zn-ribbon protein involved in translation (DUF1610 family)